MSIPPASPVVHPAVPPRLAGSASSLILTALLMASAQAVDLTGRDIGTVDQPGSTTVNAGVYTIQASGNDIWNEADSFHFASLPMTGPGRITAHITGLTNTDGWAKAGVMIRDGLAPEAANAAMFHSYGNGFAFQWRPTAGAATSNDQGNQPAWSITDSWVRLVRIGDRCWGLAMAGADVGGQWWRQMGAPVALTAAAPHFGLAVTSHNNAQVNTATFNQVTVEGLATQDAYGVLQAEQADLIVNAMIEACGDAGGGANVGALDPGDVLAWGAMDFGLGAGNLTVRAASPNGISQLAVRLDSPTGPLLGTLDIPDSDGWQDYRDATIPIDPGVANGIHPLFLISGGGHNLNWLTCTAAARITSLTAPDGYYRGGDTIPVTVTFDRAVVVDTTGGAPVLALSSGGMATYDSGSGTTALVFQYLVGAADADGRLDAAAATALTVPATSAIRGQAGLGMARLIVPVGGATAGALAFTSDVRIDNSGPQVTTVTGVESDGTYPAGTVLTIVVAFDEAVTVTGNPQLALNTTPARSAIFNAAATATLGDPTRAAFLYTVQVGDRSTRLDQTGTDALGLAGGGITDALGNASTLTVAAAGAVGSLGADRAWVIDAQAPTVTGFTGDRPAGIHGQGTAFVLTATFSKAVTLTGGTPTLSLTSGGTATYQSGSGTAAWTFAYTAAAGQAANPLAVAAWNLHGATVRDAIGNHAALSTPALTPAYDLRDALIIPAVVTALEAVDGAYRQGQSVTITLTWDRAVVVDAGGGLPTLALNTGGSAQYESGSGSTTLAFLYTVPAGANVARLDAASAQALTVPAGSTILNQADLAVATTTVPSGLASAGSLAQTSAVTIDTTAPAIAAITGDASAYHAGDTVTVTLTLAGGPVLLTAGNLPEATLHIGTSTTRPMIRTTGIGATDTLVFTYGPLARDDGMGALRVSALTIPAGQTITDAAGNPLSTVLPLVQNVGTVSPAVAVITILDQRATWDGTPIPAVYSVSPAGLACQVTYTDWRTAPPTVTTTPPTAVGDYTVKVTVVEPGYTAATSARLIITAPGGSTGFNDEDGGTGSSCGMGSGLVLILLVACAAMLRMRAFAGRWRA